VKIWQTIDTWLKGGDAEPIRCNALIVSDNQQYLSYLCGIFGGGGHEAYGSASTEDAIERLNNMDERPDVIILDFENPEENASEFLETVRIRLGKSTMPPVLFLRDTPEDEAAAHELFAADVLMKPVEPDVLLDRVCKLVQPPQVDEA
jgi:DNA-binding response OmpR family regulator